MYNDEKLFLKFESVKQHHKGTLRDCHELEPTGEGIVVLEMKLPNNQTRSCELCDILYVPKLLYNLLSVSRVTGAGKLV